MKAPEASAPFSIEPILVDLEGGRYIEPILLISLGDLVARRRSAGSGTTRGGRYNINSDIGSGSDRKLMPKVGATGGPVRVRERYEAHLPSLSLRDGEDLNSILSRAVLPILHSHVLCKNWYLCGVCWENRKRKKSHIPTPPEMAITIAGILKVDLGECQE